jgi:hypothetical protein
MHGPTCIFWANLTTFSLQWLAGDPSARSPRDLGGGVAPHGSQYYMLSDVDGFVYVALDRVDTAGYAGAARGSG